MTSVVPTADVEQIGKRAAIVARQVEDAIIAAGWPVGTALGSETELRERYGISRAVFREAVRLVEHHGVAVMRRGPSGGLIVQAPSARPATGAMAVYLEFADTTIDDLLYARLVLEPLAASLAANNLTEAGADELRQILRDEDAMHPKEIAAAGTDGLHLMIAEQSHNLALTAFIGVLSTLTRRYVAQPARMTPKVQSVATAVETAHSRLVESIIAGNANQAEYRAAKHLEAMGVWLKQRKAGPRRELDEQDRENRASDKLAEVLAARLYQDLLAGDWKIGDVIGSEADLLATYGVSRAALREAIRILEHHSVARMRRGPGGGLVMTRPDPHASIEAMALYLEYRGLDVEQLRVARDAVELACVDLLTARAHEPAIREQLEALRARNNLLGPSLAPIADDVHFQLCMLSGNPVLALFSGLLTALWGRHSPPPHTDPASEVHEAIRGAHGAIIDAILAADRDLARRRMRRHLNALTAWWQ